MAGYKAHMAFGMLTAVGWSIILFIFSFISILFVPIVVIVTIISSFNPSTSIPVGDDYKWKVVNSENNSEIDFSDDYFSVNHERFSCTNVEFQQNSFDHINKYGS